MKFLVPLLIIILNTPVCAGTISTGIGYLNPEKYRVDNEINTLPFGLSVIPIISYKSENLNIIGPKIRYNLVRGAFGLALHLETKGDRYKSEEVEFKDSGVNLGVSVRLLLLSFKYGSDVYDRYNGNTLNITLAKPFKIGSHTVFIPRVGYEYLNSSYTNYYFGVSKDEVGTYSEYELGEARNKLAGVTAILKFTSGSNISFNYSHRELDNEIYKSPTVELKSYKSFGVFWSFPLSD